MIYKYIVTIGDSLTTGARDELGFNYGFYLSMELNSRTKTKWYCIQRAETRFTIEDIRRRIYDYCRSTPDAGIVVLLIGSNNTKPSNMLPNSHFKSCYQQIIDVCHTQGKFIVLCNLPQIVLGNMPDHFNTDSLDHISRYNSLIKELAFNNGERIRFCNLNKYITEDLLIDGIHLNNMGNFIVAQQIANTLVGKINGGV